MLNDIASLLLTSYEDVLEDLRRRATVLLYAVSRNLDILQLHTLVRRYRREPEAVYREAVEFVKEPYEFKVLEEVENLYF
jgi:hypothetical protein